MKKKIIISIFVIITLILIFIKLKNEVQVRNLYDIQVYANKIENVSINIQEGSLTNTGATIVITDKNTVKNTFNEEYKIEKRVNDSWEEVKKIDNNYFFNDLIWTFEDDDTTTHDVNWENLYGELEPGKYRMIKSVEGKMFSGIQVEFEI